MMPRAKPSLFRRLFRKPGIKRSRAGLFSSLVSIADRAAQAAIGLGISHLFAYDLNPEKQDLVVPAGFDFRFLTADEVRALSADPRNQLELDMAVGVERGLDLCFGVLANGELAGYGWCALRSVEPKHTGGVPLSFPRHVGYMYKGLTHERFRGLGLNAARIVLAGHALAKRGLRHLICLVDWSNQASVQSCRRSGCQELGRLITFQLFGHRWWFYPAKARSLGIQFGAHALPDLRQRLNHSALAWE